MGGAERLALEIATRLDRSTFVSSLCASRFATHDTLAATESIAVDRMHAAGVEFLPLRRRRRGEVWPWRHLASYLRRERVDVLHAHMFGSNLWGTVLGRLVRVPVVIAHEHTWSFEGHIVRQTLDREVIARFSDAFVAVSDEDRRKMMEIERIPPQSIRTVPNGIPPNAPTPGRDIRAELEIPRDAPVIGSVGSLRAQKSYDVMIRALASLRSHHPDLRLLIVGAGPERPRLEALVSELDLQHCVSLLGHRVDVPDVLSALDVAVCSSDFEGSPLAVMEYMDAALPVVATAVGGVPDLIEHEANGLLVPAGNPLALATAIDELLRDPVRARSMGEAGRRRRIAEFDITVTIDKLEALYHELLARRRGGGSAEL